ncbi:hypothetical protein P4S72_15670 [Vibrio sp. PP-XX7]
MHHQPLELINFWCIISGAEYFDGQIEWYGLSRSNEVNLSRLSARAPVPFGWPSKGTKKAFVGFSTRYPERFYPPSNHMKKAHKNP